MEIANEIITIFFIIYFFSLLFIWAVSYNLGKLHGNGNYNNGQ